MEGRGGGGGYRLSSTTSETMVLSTPMFPFSDPARNRKKKAADRDVEKPIPSADMADPTSPITKTRFRPRQGLSAARPHHMDVRTCAAAKTAVRYPACLAISEASRAGLNHRSW